MYQRILLNNLNLSDINPRVCGRRACIPSFVVNHCDPDLYVLHYVTRGTGLYESDGKRFSVRPGEIFIVHPAEVARYTASDTDPWEYIWVGFQCSRQFAPLLKPYIIPMPNAEQLFSKIADCGSSSAREWTICSLLYQLFVQLSCQNTQGTLLQDNYVSRAINFIASNYSQPLHVAEIAGDLGLSRHYFCRIFKEQTGLSPQEYIVSHRMERAAELLSVYHLPQKEVALLTGYPDVYSFSRMFKRKFGISPGQYIKKQADA
ncbi:MAG: AraC family transcriptional regulator [Oscillospiraceae bacterium]|nr:AraC family transcriptional regulator [Oscillospiraceae bacterium]